MRSSSGALNVLSGAVLALSVLAAAGCGPRDDAPSEIEQAQSPNAERDAALAAEQLAQLGEPASADVRALYTGEFQASGTLDAVGSGEGAWELRLLEDYGLFTRPGLGQDGGAPGERQFRQGGMQVAMGPVTVTIRAEECPLPNGTALPYTAHVLFEGVAYQGCARRGVDDGARPTWASVLPDLLPAIDACLTRVAARPARVTTASLIDEAMVSVRIRENDGSRRECIAAQDGSSVSAYEPVSDLDRRTGEGDPEFQRVGGSPPPAERCRSVEDAHGRDNEVIGWLVRRSC